MKKNRSPMSTAEARLIMSLREQGASVRAISDQLRRQGYQRSKTVIADWLRGKGGGSSLAPERITAVVKSERPRILYFDIETTNFSAGFGEILCMGYRWHGMPGVQCIKIHDFPGWDSLDIERRDLYLCQYVSDIVTKAQVLIGHYSKKFDHAFIQTRLLIHGLHPIPDTPHIDTWRIARYQLRLANNKMKTIAKSLGCDNLKSKVPLHIWRRANAFDTDAIDQIAEYCMQDVRVQYEMTQKLLPIARNMPCRNLFIDGEQLMCPGCGGNNIVESGTIQTKVNTYQRYQCSDCGKWMRGRRTLTPQQTERLMP